MITKIKGYFHFPFYGHKLDKLYVTTGGFLSLSPSVHGFIYKIQYIAPLRLKLDPSLSEESKISYKLTEKSLTVEWKQMRLLNLTNGQDEATFQVIFQSHLVCLKFTLHYENYHFHFLMLI